MRYQHALTALICLLAPACGTVSAETGGEPRAVATVEVHQTLGDGPMYIEGSVPHVRIVDAEGAVLIDRDLPQWRLDEPLLTETLPAGTYRILTHQRPCEGNCAHLDPPTDRCETTFRAAAGQRVQLEIRLKAGQGCTIIVT